MAYLLSAGAGGVIVDASSSGDLLGRLLSFITGGTPATGTALPVGEYWEVLKYSSSQYNFEAYLRGPGLSATDSVYCNIRLYSDVANNLHNWQLYGATGFDGTKSIDEQPGTSTVDSFFTVSNTTMPYWFVVNGRRIIIVAQTSAGVSMACYMGLYVPYATPSEFPYPYAIGGTTTNPTYGYQENNYTVGNFYDGPYEYNTDNAALALRHPDGTWLGFGNYFSSTSARGDSTSLVSTIAPMNSKKGSQSYPGYGIIQSFNDNYIILPFTLQTKAQGGNTYGELDGMYFAPHGTQGKKFPDTITDGTGNVYLVISNTYRDGETQGSLLLE
jgi:hypothetical protein